MVEYRVSGANSIYINELYQVLDTHGRPKSCWQHLLFPINLTRACCVKSFSSVWCCRPNWHGPSTDPPTHRARALLTWQARTPVAWHIPWQTEDLALLSIILSWRMLDSKFTTQDQRCPWVSASSNIHLGSSIWAPIISARYCFVYFGSQKALRNRELAGVANPIGYPISFLRLFSSCGFVECRPVKPVPGCWCWKIPALWYFTQLGRT